MRGTRSTSHDCSATACCWRPRAASGSWQRRGRGGDRRGKRGRAAGFIVIGSGFAIIVSGKLIPFINKLVGPEGWRVSWLIISGAVIGIAFLSYALLRDRPEEKGLKPLGSEDRVSPSEPVGAAAGRATTGSEGVSASRTS